MPGTIAGKTSRKKSTKKSKKQATRKTTKQAAAEAAMAEALSEELKALGLTPAQMAKFIDRIGRIAEEIENVRPTLMAVYKELEVRRRMAEIEAGIFPPKKSVVRRVVGGALSGVKDLASGIAGIFKRSEKAKPESEWSIPALKSKLEELGGKVAADPA